MSSGENRFARDLQRTGTHAAKFSTGRGGVECVAAIGERVSRRFESQGTDRCRAGSGWALAGCVDALQIAGHGIEESGTASPGRSCCGRFDDSARKATGRDCSAGIAINIARRGQLVI